MTAYRGGSGRCGGPARCALSLFVITSVAIAAVAGLAYRES